MPRGRASAAGGPPHAAAIRSPVAPIRNAAGLPDSGPRCSQRLAPAARTPTPGTNTAAVASSAITNSAGARRSTRAMPTRTTTAPSTPPTTTAMACRNAKWCGAPRPGGPGRAPALATIARPSAPSPTAGTISKATAAVRRAISETEEEADAGVEEIAEHRV